MKDEAFKIRAYDKSELALLYFPNSSQEVAWKRLKRWLELNPDLRSLARVRVRGFSPREVKKIVKFLGEPFDTE